jgi:hypothetical protein
VSNKRNPALAKQRRAKFLPRRKLRKAWNAFFRIMGGVKVGFEIWSESVIPFEAFNVPQTQYLWKQRSKIIGAKHLRRENLFLKQTTRKVTIWTERDRITVNLPAREIAQWLIDMARDENDWRRKAIIVQIDAETRDREMTQAVNGNY